MMRTLATAFLLALGLLSHSADALIVGYSRTSAAPIGGNDANTVLLLHMDGTDGSTTFTDSAVGGTGTPHTVTAGGNSQIDTARFVFGGASGLFDGTGDHLSAADHADFDQSGGVWTIDFRVYVSTVNNGARLYMQETNSTNRMVINLVGAASPQSVHLFFDNAGGSPTQLNLSSSANVPSGQWVHIAVVEDGDNFYIFIDGVLRASTTSTARPANMSGAIWIGDGYGSIGADAHNGSFDEFRASKGVARWTADFTPAAAPYN